jgi:hypothetical protein
MATKRLTVSAKWLEMAAAALEKDAKDSLAAWIVLGQAHRYCENLGMAAALRRAKLIKNIGERREFLRGIGIPDSSLGVATTDTPT